MNNFLKEIQKSMIFKIHFMNKKKKVKNIYIAISLDNKLIITHLKLLFKINYKKLNMIMKD